MQHFFMARVMRNFSLSEHLSLAHTSYVMCGGQAVLVEDVYVRHIENAASNPPSQRNAANTTTSGGDTRRQGRQDKSVPVPREPEQPANPAFPSFFARMQVGWGHSLCLN